ncbi:cathepsin-d [Plakobranchus ocellatus]|uniref:Cathepsin-d n=1 Tax=Plakobranchus ocellatus TaxID=259542 RepID=A0AAV4CY74_9GAST|nr:cathepsin-d [Plakobranchus ocellatus]
MHLFPAVLLTIIVAPRCAAGDVNTIPLTGINRPTAYLNSFQPYRAPHRLHATNRREKLPSLRNNLHRGPEPSHASSNGQFKLPKFDFSFLTKSKKPPVSNLNIELKRSVNDMYYGKINVGTPGQEFNVVFYTGFSLTWILSSHSPSHFTLSEQRKYNNDSSSTYKSEGTAFDIKYPFGQVAGYVSQDSISLAGLTVENQTFGEAIKQLEMFKDTVIDGVVGLGFRDLSWDKETNLLDNMVKQGVLKAPIFSFYFGRVGNGSRSPFLTLGGVNPDFFTGDFTFVNLSVPLKWQFDFDRVQLFDGENIFCNAGCQAKVESTTWMIVGPYADVHRLNAKLGARQTSVQGTNVLYEFDCSEIDNLPDVEFIINGEKLSLSSKDYVVKRFRRKTMACYSAFVGRKTVTKGNESLWTLGQAFMRGFYTHFDKANSRIGFAKAKH